jgi:putative flippase GtrA
MIHHFFSKQFAVFLLTGGFAALVNFTSRIGLNRIFDYPIAIVLAYIIGMITAFILAKLIVFKASEQSIHRSALYFVLVNIVAVVQTWIISMVLAYYVLPYFGFKQFVPEIAHAVGLTVPIFTSYIGHKRLSFR